MAPADLEEGECWKTKQCITSERGEHYFSMFKIITASDKTVDYRAKQFTQTR